MTMTQCVNAGQLKLESDVGLATRRELQLLEEEAELGRVWHVPISWSMIMIRRFAMINTLWTVDDLEIVLNVFRSCYLNPLFCKF